MRTTPLTPDELVTALRAEGATVVEHAGWRTNRRPQAWAPIHGSMVHHTASGDGPGLVELCYNGRADLPGPLCTGVVRKDGTVHLVGSGRSNHAGRGSSAVFAAVKAGATIPPTGSDVVDGNAHFYGWEAVNRGDGNDPWPEVQLDAIARVQAALCRVYGWNAQHVIGHREWTTRKIDPRGFSMAAMRTRVANLLEEETMDAQDVWAYVGKKSDGRNAMSYLIGLDKQLKTVVAQNAALSSALAALAAQGGLDAAEVQAAAEAGAQAALERLADAIAE